MANGLPFFHALSDCDTTSQFANHGKKSAWATWLAWPEMTETCMCTLARGLIMFLDPENIGVTVGIMSLSAIISEMSINTSLCVGHLRIQYGSHHSDI